MNAQFTITGIDSSWYVFNPNPLAAARTPTSYPVSLTFNTPSDAVVNDYTITIIASGKRPVVNSTETTSKTITLRVLAGANQSQQQQNVNQTQNTTNNTTTTATQTNPLTGLITFITSPQGIPLVVIIIILALAIVFRGKVKETLKSAKKRLSNVKMPSFKKDEYAPGRGYAS